MRAGPPQRPETATSLATAACPIVLSQTFRAIIHSRMRVGMENTATNTACRRRAVRDRPRGCRDVLRQHLQLRATQAPLCGAYQKTRQIWRKRPPRCCRSLRSTGSRSADGSNRRPGPQDHRRADRPAPAQRRTRRQATACGNRRATSRTRSTIWSAGWPGALVLSDTGRLSVHRSRPWRKKSVPAARANGSSKPASRCSTVRALRASPPRTSPTR